jgi:predicted nuclease of predicted toxin-antitoxin system
VITSDRDFGDKVYRDQYPHRGVILLRLENERSANKIYVLQQVLEQFMEQLADSFVVVTETQIRFARIR